MGQQALYIVSYLGRDRFVWAASAAEAREKVFTPFPPLPSPTPRQSVATIGPRDASDARRVRLVG